MFLCLFFSRVNSQAASGAENDSAYFFRAWTAEDGLPENKVVGLAQTSDGFLWVATQGGVVRFDGVRFEPFEAATTAGYVSSTMRVMYLDRDGSVWIAKEGGIVCVDGTQVRAFTAKDGLPHFEGQRSMAEDGEGNLWISYTKGSVLRLDKSGQVKYFDAKDGLPTAGVCVLTSDRNGQLWFAKNGRIGVFRDGQFVTLLKLAPHFTCLAPARAGGIWICSGSEVMKFNEGTALFTLAELPAVKSPNEPTALLEDREGAVWVGTAANGLFRCDTNGAATVDVSYAVISSLAEDREGNIWVGTRGGGLNRVQHRVVSLIGEAAGLPFEGVQSVCQDAAGRLWLVEQNGALVRRQDNRWATPTEDKRMAFIHAMSVAADDKGTVWIGGNHGDIYQFTDDKFQRLDLDGDLPKGGVRSLLASASGDLWLAIDGSDTNGAIYRLHGGDLKKFELTPGYRFVRAMAEDAAGNFWAGASDGLLVRVTGDTLVDETAKSPGYSIRCLHGTPDGSLWIGFAGYGVGQLKDGRMLQFSSDQGLPNNYVSQILADNRGGIWFAGNQGIFQVREQEFEDVAAGRSPRIQSVLYGRSQGLPNLQASFDYFPNSLRSADGRLYFSMLTGLAELRPDRIRPNRLPPVVVIENVQADNRLFAVYQNGEPSTNTPSVMELKDSGNERELRLPPGPRQIQIEFSALSFVAPENVRFRYQLEGLDSGWVDAGTHRSVEYSYLPPGDYRFKVTACNNDGIWNETGSSLAIIVEPHIWETLWFKLSVTALTFGLLSGAIVLVLRRRHRLQILHLEQQRTVERERSRIARDLHDDLGVGLTEIGLLGDLAGAPAATLETSRGYLHEITGRARDLVALLDEIVWAINPANDTSQSLGDYFFKYAQTLLHRASIRCRLEIIEPFPRYSLNAEERHQLFLAFKEALNNVIRHAGATEVRVSLGAANGNLMIRVTDNGHGVSASTVSGSRDGLAGMRERLQRLGGRCEISGVETGGTAVTLVIPIRQPKEL